MLPNPKGAKKASFGGGDLQAYLNMVTQVKETEKQKEIDSQYELLTAEPADWDTNFEYYFEKVDGNYIPVAGVTAPTWTENTYYKKKNT